MYRNSETTLRAALPERRAEIVQLAESCLAPAALREALGAYHERDIAAALEQLGAEAFARVTRCLTAQTLAAVLECSARCFARLDATRKAEVLACMEGGAAAELLQGLAESERAALLALLPPERAREIGLIRSFGADEIGSRMSTNFIAIPAASGVKEAMSALIRQAAEHDNISTLYLVDDAGALCGAVDLKDLIVARDGTPLSRITTCSYPYLYARSRIEDCLPLLGEYGEASIPVLGEGGVLLGVITAQDFADLLDDARGDDYAKLAGLASEEDLAEPIARSVRKRLPWLCVLLVLGLGVSAVIG